MPTDWESWWWGTWARRTNAWAWLAIGVEFVVELRYGVPAKLRPEAGEPYELGYYGPPYLPEARMIAPGLFRDPCVGTV